ncbi:MAG: hypothetical protein XD95_0210 [Microgenomates bacterium 39_7]|nr:MAG: hypothetical protein XD95_0210 [Microgenomates bacterium 39_7]
MWLLIPIFIIIFIYWQKNSKGLQNNDTNNIEEIWRITRDHTNIILQRDSQIENQFENYRKLISAIQKDMILIRERLMHDKSRQKMFAEDWLNFTNAIWDIKTAMACYEADGNHDLFSETMNECVIIIKEIAKRIENELGSEAEIPKIIKRFNG